MKKRNMTMLFNITITETEGLEPAQYITLYCMDSSLGGFPRYNGGYVNTQKVININTMIPIELQVLFPPEMLPTKDRFILVIT